MSNPDFDLFIIGGGSGGVRAGRIASRPRRQGAVAEEYRFGGTCPIRGCIPKKLLVYASRFRDDFEDAEGLRLDQQGHPLRLADPARQQGPGGQAGWRASTAACRGAPAPNASTRARRWSDANTVVLASDERKVTARTILIATGGHPVKGRTCPVSRACHHLQRGLQLKELPASILIVGGGYIAVEFAGIFDGLGRRKRRSSTAARRSCAASTRTCATR